MTNLFMTTSVRMSRHWLEIKYNAQTPILHAEEQEK